MTRQDNTNPQPSMWRSLDELEQAPDFEEWLGREFPRQAAVWPEGLDRRSFLQLTGASLALGGLTACTRQPLEKIVPYGRQVEDLVPGEPLYFATGLTVDGYATGVLAESHMGRPTKIEGNPEHPVSLGSTDLLAQAAVLGLYDPDRSKTILQLGRIRTWSTFVDETRRAVTALDALEGARIRFLTETVTSPSLAAQMRGVLAKYPRAGWVQYDPVGRDDTRGASVRAYGRALETRFDVAKADVILSLDSDFLTSGPGHIPYARAFAERRRIRKEDADLNRLYALESTPTLTGTMADHRRAASLAEIGHFTVALAARLGVDGVASEGPPSTVPPDWIEAIAADLEAHPGRSLVLAGDQTPAPLQVLALAINEHLDNRGRTLLVSEPIEAGPVEAGPAQQTEALATLVEEMQAGQVDILVILGGNPVYNAPADLDFREAMLEVPRRVRLGDYEDETSEYCQWHVPRAHQLESWGDARSLDGTVTLQQPLIEPLYSGRTVSELLSVFADDKPQRSEQILEDYWNGKIPGANGDFEADWRRLLHDGFVPGTEAPMAGEALQDGATAAAVQELAALETPTLERPDLTLRPDPTVWDGRFSNNGWLQECPKPLTKLTWDNALLISPALGASRGIETGQLLEITVGERTLTAAAWIHPGQADASVTLHLGYGRWKAGSVGTEQGFNAYALRTTDRTWHAPEVSLLATGESYPLASTQLHHNMELEGAESTKRHLVRAATLTDFGHDPEFAKHLGHTPDADMSLFPAWKYEGHAWGLTIDLGACTGCNACVISCQAENNIPVVGKDQVARGREMHWIRIDRYYQGGLAAPTVHHQPVICMHCEQAPCEVVCPVAATVHSDEGLNDMVYNRCVGTRYCANNCPYKVRRFNFLLYNDWETPVLKLLRNPDVTVRSRGVMEKCTYCVQRINKVKIAARREDRAIEDGEIRTACQQVCPTEAIVFGDLNDKASRVAHLKESPLNYGILEDLNTRPRTTYLAKVSNPNPALAGATAAAGERHG